MVEGINEDRVVDWLKRHVPELQPPITFSLITGGRSNLTFHCTDRAGSSYVLRRPPLGQVLESAHDVGREHRIISALAGTDVPVPPSYGLCTDIEVNDAPFYVMKYVEGTVPHDSVVGATIPRGERRELGLHLIEILTRLHKTDPDEVGLGDLGRKEAYLSRQLNRWTKQWQAMKTEEIPDMEESCRILLERMPDQVGATIVHGDYRIGNMIVSEGKIQAVLDWELCTLGDPLADVGYLLNSWMSADEVEMGPGDMAATAVGGYPQRSELCEIYERATGRDLSNIDYYRAFSHWRLASIGQGVYKRYLVGAMGDQQDVDVASQLEAVRRRAQSALQLLTG